MATTGSREGVFVIADISGYSRFVTGVELEHSTDIVADLLGVVVEQLRAVAALAKLEGDAAFCVCAHVPSNEAILSSLFGCYDAFRRRLRDARHLTTCTCAACEAMPNLDLKLIVHAGPYVSHSIAGNDEVTGPGVITVHRLLKNTVTETTGLRGYALLTASAVDAMHIPIEGWDATAGREDVDDVGPVETFVVDLSGLWANEQERNAVVVDPAGARSASWYLAAPPPVVWEHFADPSKRRRWNQADSIDVDAPDAPTGVGTVNHCVHGKRAITEEILDWKPFRYSTLRVDVGPGRFLMTVHLEPEGEGTRATVYMRPESGGLRGAPIKLMLATVVRRDFNKGMERLQQLIEAEPAPTSVD